MGKAPVRLAQLVAVLAAGAAMIRARRRGEVWHSAADEPVGDGDNVAGQSGEEGP
jgi:hypothetical protein